MEEVLVRDEEDRLEPISLGKCSSSPLLQQEHRLIKNKQVN